MLLLFSLEKSVIVMKGTMKGGQVLHSFSQVVNSDMLPLGGHTTYNPEKNHSGDI